MRTEPAVTPSEKPRRRRGLRVAALVGLAVVGLSACGGRAFLSMQAPVGSTSEIAEGLVDGPGLQFTYDAEGKVVSITGIGTVPWIDGSGRTRVVVNINRKADGIHYEGTWNAQLKNGLDCDWTIAPEAYNVPLSGLAGRAVSNCESELSSASWRFDPT